MNKDVSHLLQFVAVAGVVFVFFYVAAIYRQPTSIAELHNLFLEHWIYAFMFLSAIRFGLVEIIWRQTIWGKRSGDSIQSNGKYLLNQLSETIQYLIIAALSICLSFWTALNNFIMPGWSIDIISLWLGMQEAFLVWFAFFTILSFLRLGIVTLKRFLP